LNPDGTTNSFEIKIKDNFEDYMDVIKFIESFKASLTTQKLEINSQIVMDMAQYCFYDNIEEVIDKAEELLKGAKDKNGEKIFRPN
jgi:hypothetical protein